MDEAEKFSIAMTSEMNGFLRGEGFDTTGSSMWEIYCWSGRAWESSLTSIVCMIGDGTWSIMPMGDKLVGGCCSVPFECPFEDVVKVLRRVSPDPVEWEYRNGVWWVKDGSLRLYRGRGGEVFNPCDE